MLKLNPHPDHPPSNPLTVTVTITSGAYGSLFLDYSITPAHRVRFDDNLPYGRQDGLWKHTCFEMFVRDFQNDSYSEFNFAPPFAWAAYHFERYRKRRSDRALLVNPHLVDSRVDDRSRRFPDTFELNVVLDRKELGETKLKLALSAVIEETGGTKSYWALKHPPGPPDFHHPDCFALTLPAPE